MLNAICMAQKLMQTLLSYLNQVLLVFLVRKWRSMHIPAWDKTLLAQLFTILTRMRINVLHQ